MITVLEPHPEVLYHTEERLEFHDSKGLIRVLPVNYLKAMKRYLEALTGF